MKKTKYLLLVFLTFFTKSIIAQSDLSEGSVNLKDSSIVSFDANKVNSKTPENVKENVIVQDDEKEEKSKWGANFEVTLVSRFIWRGLVLGDYPSIQPNVTFSRRSFFTGVWASYSLSSAERVGASSSAIPVAENYKEIIPYVGFGLKTGETSKLTLMLLTHYNPNVGGFFDFNNKPNGGPALTNRVEFRTLFSVGKFDFFSGLDFINDPSDNKSWYLEVGYTIDMPKGIKLRPFISGVPEDNFYTKDGKADITQIGWYTTKSVPIVKDIDLAVKVDMVYNPDRDQFDAAFGVTVKF